MYIVLYIYLYCMIHMYIYILYYIIYNHHLITKRVMFGALTSWKLEDPCRIFAELFLAFLSSWLIRGFSGRVFLRLQRAGQEPKGRASTVLYQIIPSILQLTHSYFDSALQ